MYCSYINKLYYIDYYYFEIHDKYGQIINTVYDYGIYLKLRPKSIVLEITVCLSTGHLKHTCMYICDPSICIVVTERATD